MQIMNHIDILDKVKINIFRGHPTKNDPNPLRVLIEPIEKDKNLVFDENALQILNAKISEFVIEKGLSTKENNTFKYIEEFVGRMISELHKNGLVVLEDIPDAPEDPYKDVRYKYKD